VIADPTDTILLRHLYIIVDEKRAILGFDVSSDGVCLAAGTELKGDEAHILFW
jgi:hypothetical protein